MLLINYRQLHLQFGHRVLFNGINLQIESGEHVCLLGRNGMGKTTLLKVIAGSIAPDSGYLEQAQNISITYLPQIVPENFSGTVYDVVASGSGELGDWLSQYEHLTRGLHKQTHESQMTKLNDLQGKIEKENGWELNQRINKILSLMTLDGTLDVATLSGGLQRRVLLAKALVNDPDLLILDEPTNHLDLESIEWLENFLKKYKKAILFVTHDRAFMQALATRMLELDHGDLISWKGSYHDFLTHKAASLEAERNQQALFDKKLSQEEAWIRQGIKARRTRNEGRVRALKKMRTEYSARCERMGQIKISAQEFTQSGKIVFHAENICYGSLLKNFTTTVLRGDRIGILGPNGSGKSTLLRILLGQLQPDSGTVQAGTNLKIAYFDQHRILLDENKTVQENVSPGGDMLTIQGKSRHVISYLQDFLFSPERARSLVKVLSGGERNRLMLAHLFSLDANVYVFDEPTNDLDIETLELLEEQLLTYQGTLLLVSHDREFLNHVVTSTLVLEGHGKVGKYVGGYEDMLRQRAHLAKSEIKKVEAKKIPAKTTKTSKKLSYKETVELEQLPNTIEQLEQLKISLQESMIDPNFYQQSTAEITATKQQLEQVENQITLAYERWDILERKRNGLGACA